MVIVRWVALATVGLLAGCGAAQPQGSPQPRTFTVPLYDGQAREVGRVTMLQQGRDSVLITVTSTALAAGVHGTHLHAVGMCDAPGFTTAGAHLNPFARKHGLRNPAGPHLGDLPNLSVAAGGAGSAQVTLRGSLTPGQEPYFDADGTALVVHAAADDMVTDPSGNSGARVACAVLATPSAPIR